MLFPGKNQNFDPLIYADTVQRFLKSWQTNLRVWEISVAEPRSIIGDFSGTDELLAMAQAGSLENVGPVRVTRAGRVGPLIELAWARSLHPSLYPLVTAEAPFALDVDRAIMSGVVCGSDRGSRFGIFPLVHLGPEGDQSDQWTLWFSRADQAAQTAGFSSSTAAMIMGAFGELQDNVFRHSGAYASGLIAYAITSQGFELVVSDQGIGVLRSLRTHPDHADVGDAGSALRRALANGESRFGRDSGCGLGIGQIFRALANQDGDLRFRSDDHVLEIQGDSPTLQGQLEIRHKAALPGLTVSVLCRPFGRRPDETQRP